jgi:molybdopterin converting factor subunit 1
MTVTILYFAALRELLGIGEEHVAVTRDVLTVQELAEQLVERHPALRPHLASVRFAVNESFVDSKASVNSGDTVALIPPVSGG